MNAIALPGARDVRGVLDGATGADAVVVVCPPHPQHGGSRSDQRLRAVSDALVDSAVACLRFEYGPWDEGRGEQSDARNALAWAADNFDTVGLFGYSFGAGIALRAAGDGPPPAAVSALAPPGDAADALAGVSCPVQIVHGERDEAVDSAPVVARARELGSRVESIPADHHFVGQTDRVASVVADFFVRYR